MLKYKTTAVLALAAFALGLVTGKGFDSLQASTATGDGCDRCRGGHCFPRDTRASVNAALGTVVATTLQMRGVSTTTASSAPAIAGFARPRSHRLTNLRRQRKFKDAATVYRRVVASGGMTADAWADYADALASADSTLQGEPAKAVAKALELDPRHAKALWLKASLEHEEHHYTDAVQHLAQPARGGAGRTRLTHASSKPTSPRPVVSRPARARRDECTAPLARQCRDRPAATGLPRETPLPRAARPTDGCRQRGLRHR